MYKENLLTTDYNAVFCLPIVDTVILKLKCFLFVGRCNKRKEKEEKGHENGRE